jgi:6-phosphofructokinase 2
VQTAARQAAKEAAPVKPIVTVTLNPCIDNACEAAAVRPTRKIRTTNERFYPGGGGINVARVIAELGGAALPVYLSGGPTGPVLDELMRTAGFAPVAVPIAGATRISHAVFDRSTGLEYRFVAEGPEVAPAEWARCRETIAGLDFDWLVASGSLPRGLPADAYAELARLAAGRGGRFVLDTSGPALAATLAAGGVYLAKPSFGELEALVGRPLPDPAAQDAAALEVVRDKGLALLAVTMGHHGALLAGPGGVTRLLPPSVRVRSATGAGDSFLGGMVLALAEGASPLAALRRGVAAGTAAVLNPGTELCRRADVLRLEAALAA